MVAGAAEDGGVGFGGIFEPFDIVGGLFFLGQRGGFFYGINGAFLPDVEAGGHEARHIVIAPLGIGKDGMIVFGRAYEHETAIVGIVYNIDCRTALGIVNSGESVILVGLRATAIFFGAVSENRHNILQVGFCHSRTPVRIYRDIRQTLHHRRSRLEFIVRATDQSKAKEQ